MTFDEFRQAEGAENHVLAFSPQGLAQIQRLEQDLDDELLLHVEMRAEENLDAGMSPAEARYDAQRALAIRRC